MESRRSPPFRRVELLQNSRSPQEKAMVFNSKTMQRLLFAIALARASIAADLCGSIRALVRLFRRARFRGSRTARPQHGEKPASIGFALEACVSGLDHEIDRRRQDLHRRFCPSVSACFAEWVRQGHHSAPTGASKRDPGIRRHRRGVQHEARRRARTRNGTIVPANPRSEVAGYRLGRLLDANTESRSTIPKSARKCLAECAAVDASNKYPGGGLISSADDYARFLIELGSGRLIGPQSLAQMKDACR